MRIHSAAVLGAGVMGSQIAAMQYGKIQAGIASWWGQGTYTDAQIPGLLTASTGSGSQPFCWTLYYEPAVTNGATQIAGKNPRRRISSSTRRMSPPNAAPTSSQSPIALWYPSSI